MSPRGALDTGGLVILWAFIVVAGVRLVSAMVREQRALQEDFAVYYLGAQALREQRDPYTVNIAKIARVEGANTHDIRRSSDPPTFLLLFEPLAVLPLHLAYWVWQAINFICLGAALAMLLGLNPKLDLAPAAAIAGLALLYPAVGVHFWMGQSKLPVLLLLALTMRSIASGREMTAGLALALAALLRIFPLAIIGYFALQRRRRVGAYTVAGLVLGSSVTVGLTGVATAQSFISSLSFLTGHWWEHDISLRCFVAHAVWAVHPYPVYAAKIARCAITALMYLAILMMTVRATLMFGNRDDPDLRIFSLWVAASIFLLPVAWDYDLTLMLIPFVQIACAAVRGEASRRALVTAALGYTLMLVWELVIGRTAPPETIFKITVGQGGFFSMAAAYLAAYWFAVDARGAIALPMREMPARVWQRVTPAVFGISHYLRVAIIRASHACPPFRGSDSLKLLARRSTPLEDSRVARFGR